MGQHFVNFSFVGDGLARRHASRARNLRDPPERAFETHRRRIPRVQGPVGRRACRAAAADGTALSSEPAPNRYRLPAFYSLHVWAWKENPFGAFVNWHPNVSCEAFTADDSQPPPDPGKDG